jgi:hypothetical protein
MANCFGYTAPSSSAPYPDFYPDPTPVPNGIANPLLSGIIPKRSADLDTEINSYRRVKQARPTVNYVRWTSGRQVLAALYDLDGPDGFTGKYIRVGQEVLDTPGGATVTSISPPAHPAYTAFASSKYFVVPFNGILYNVVIGS